MSAAAERAPVPPKLALASFIFAIGWASPLFKLAGAPELLASAARVGFATILLLPFFWKDAAAAFVKSPRGCARALLAAALLAAHFAVWVPSLQLTTVAASTLLVATEPLFAAAIESVLLREHFPKRLIIGILISLGGTGVILGADFQQSELLSSRALKGDALALAGAVFGACYFVVGRTARREIPVGGYLILVNGFAAVMLLIGSVLRGEPWFKSNPGFPGWEGITLLTLLYFLLLAIVPQLLGHGAANIAVRHYPATVVNLAVLSEPVLASVLAFLLFKEAPDHLLLFFIGGAILLSGLILSLSAKKS